MTYYGAKELAEAFRTVRKNTLAIAADIPDDKYAFRPANGARSVVETLAHIGITNRFMHKFHAVEHRTSFVGIDFPSLITAFTAEEKRPRTKKETIEMLRSDGETFASWLGGLSDEFLAERVESGPGQSPASKSRFELLLGVKEHEMHHRGQLMVIERILGIVPHLTRERENRLSGAGSARS